MNHSFRPQPDPRPAMEQALEKAIELSSGSTSYPVTAGQLVSEEHRRYRYTFVLVSGSWNVPDGTDLHLSSGKFDDPLLVQLSHTTDEVVTIITTQRVPSQTLAAAQLVVDHTYLLRKMKDALNPLTMMATPANLGLKLFGHLDCPDLLAAPQVVETISEVFTPDEAQRLAIQRALASDVLMILGPPGTGKTDVLAAIALLHAVHSKKRRVLLVSHTNIAIDNAIIRLVGFLRTHDLGDMLDAQLVIRCGHPQVAELETEPYRNVTLLLIVGEAVERQQEQIDQLELQREMTCCDLANDQQERSTHVRVWQQRKAALAHERTQAHIALDHLEAEKQRHLASIREQVTLLQKQEEQATQHLAQARAAVQTEVPLLAPLQRAWQQQHHQNQAERTQLDQLRIHPRFTRFFVQLTSGVWEKDVNARLLMLTASLKTLTTHMAPIQQRLAQARHASEQHEQQCKELASALVFWAQQREELLAATEQQQAPLRQKWNDLDREWQDSEERINALDQLIEQGQHRIARIDTRLAQLEHQMGDVTREVTRERMETAQIVAVTLTGFYMNPVLLNQTWDVVLIDEGSMAPPPAVLIAADRATSHLIVVGDPLQLAPVCAYKDDLVKHWLGRDVFHHGGYTLEQAATGLHHSVLLPYQGRMESSICDLIRGPIYQGCLKDRHPHAPRPQIGPEPASPVVLYDTSGSPQARAQQPANGKSRYNPYHAEVAIHLAWQALATMPNKKPECLGIVTPYAAQRDYLKRLVHGTDLEIYARIGTVHAFQGLEFDALIFDLVEAPGLKIAPFLKGAWGSDAMRLLNVAVTRARHKLLIVAHMAAIRREPQRSLLRHITELACQKKCLAAESLPIEMQ